MNRRWKAAGRHIQGTLRPHQTGNSEPFETRPAFGRPDRGAFQYDRRNSVASSVCFKKCGACLWPEGRKIHLLCPQSFRFWRNAKLAPVFSWLQQNKKEKQGKNEQRPQINHAGPVADAFHCLKGVSLWKLSNERSWKQQRWFWLFFRFLSLSSCFPLYRIPYRRTMASPVKSTAGAANTSR